ncbi:hypothetical protein RUMLAC_00048 [[Ruminococcus] lactaris ATCC 29176]|uniref:Uncharacterized protein n=1 Tax=[Ruminococcus] lactaris ATCC 29176 TaxID=471875 RepID=B5CKT4_9FIRM|nr:hypothetical protein RUMLAC_00048 [[Ruminococcus] lactaris ATCC 29176]
MKQRSQWSGAKPIHRREVFNGTDTDTKAKSEPENLLSICSKGRQGRYGDSENPHSIGCEGFRGFYSYLKE